VFCASAALFGYKFNSRHATRVVDQIEATRDRFGVEFVCLGDLTFMAHKPTGIAICEELIRRDLGVRWSTQTTIGRIDPASARLMAASGCVQIGFGVESGSKLIIEANNKNVHIERTEEQFAAVKDAGLSVQTYWVFGLPGETVATAMRSIELMRDWIARELIDAVHITMAVPYPGTPLGENPAAYGIRIVDRNFDNYGTSSASLGIGLPVIESKDLTREHIYMFWQLAHAAAGDEFARRFAKLDGSVHYIPRAAGTGDAPLADVLLPDPGRLGRRLDLVPDENLSRRTLVEIRRSRDQLRQGDAGQ
jgi:anaerobic magnesium-protoporphyrin IX monomethyl ester cyclase